MNPFADFPTTMPFVESFREREHNIMCASCRRSSRNKGFPRAADYTDRAYNATIYALDYHYKLPARGTLAESTCRVVCRTTFARRDPLSLSRYRSILSRDNAHARNLISLKRIHSALSKAFSTYYGLLGFFRERRFMGQYYEFLADRCALYGNLFYSQRKAVFSCCERTAAAEEITGICIQ